MDKMLGALKSKTAWFGLLIAILGTLQDQIALLTQIVGADNIGKVVSAIGVLVMILRGLTNGALEDKVK